MKKINLFFIIAFKEQTYKYDKKLKKMLQQEKRNRICQVSSLMSHLYILSKHFNLYNFFEYEDKINEFENPVIYHIPYGLDDKDTGVESILLQYKKRIPTVMLTYDPHTPIKTGSEYMKKYHDLCITFLKERVDGEQIIWGYPCFDSYLIHKYKAGKRKKFACMILRRHSEKNRFISKEQFLQNGLNLEKTYGERDKITNNRKIDIYGMAWPATLKNYKGVIAPYDQKYEILKNYKFNIIFENAVVDNYISEKILDSFLTVTIPVYFGSPVTASHIPSDCYLDILHCDNYSKFFSELETFADEKVQEYQNAILKNRDRIFEKFSTKENFSKLLYTWYNQRFGTDLGLSDNEYYKIEDDIKKLHFYKSNKLLFDIIRRLRLFLQFVKEKRKSEHE